MSFRRKGPGVLASGAIGALTGVALIGGVLALLSLPAHAQAATVSGEFERPFGFGYGQESQSFEANTRDANGNRLILDGRIMTGMDQSTLSTATASASAWAQATAGAGFSNNNTASTAIGNQINVITQGSFNTVIVNATQTNNGNQTTVLNGQLNLR